MKQESIGTIVLVFCIELLFQFGGLVLTTHDLAFVGAVFAVLGIFPLCYTMSLLEPYNSHGEGPLNTTVIYYSLFALSTILCALPIHQLISSADNFYGIAGLVSLVLHFVLFGFYSNVLVNYLNGPQNNQDKS